MVNIIKKAFNKLYGNSYRKKVYCDECKKLTEEMKLIDRRKLYIDIFVLSSVIIVSLFAIFYTIPNDRLNMECQKKYIANTELNKLCISINCFDYTFEDYEEYVNEINKNPLVGNKINEIPLPTR